MSSDTSQGQQLIDALNYAFQARAYASSNGTSTLNGQTNSIPTDPYLFYKEWPLLNVGQQVNFGDLQPIYGKPGEDINVLPAWQSGLTGQGIYIGVVDTGVQMNHPDLQQNISTLYAYNAITGSHNANPTGNDAAAAHGTAVAGLIGAVANGTEGVGVAYGATIVPIKLADPNPDGTFSVTDQQLINAASCGWGPHRHLQLQQWDI